MSRDKDDSCWCSPWAGDFGAEPESDCPEHGDESTTDAEAT